MIEIDGKKQAAEGTVLQCIRRAGKDVPTWCSDDVVGGGGHCRSCVVDIDGRKQIACKTEARAGMTVTTQSPELETYRQDLGALMASESRPGGRVAADLERLGVDVSRYPALGTTGRQDASHRYLRIDTSRCIQCRLCTEACDQVQGQFVFSFTGRGASSALTWGDGDFADTACVSCGACVQACPSAAITDIDRQRPAAALRSTRTTCSYCGVGCQLEVYTDGDKVHHIDGVASASANRGHLCVKGRYAHGFLHHPDRLRTPLMRRDGELLECTWEEAIAAVANAFNAARGKVAALSSSRCTNEENYLVQKWMRAGMATHNVDCCARVCHAPTATGMRKSFGTGAATNSLADIESADVILVAGCNPTEAHPVTGARIKARVLSGAARLIVLDPRRTELASLADVHLALESGSNIALLNSLAAVIIEEQLVDESYVDRFTAGTETLKRHLADYAPEKTETITGVPAELVRQAARLYASASHPLQVHGLGMTEHYQGSESVMLLCNLAALVGGLGRPGVGVNPLRGQNNVQGAADMGCQPDSMTGYANPNDPDARRRFAAEWGREVPTEPGLTLPKMYDAARAGKLKALYILGEDVVQSDPAVHVDSALEALEFLVVQELFLSDTAKRADVVLPGASFLEKDGTFTNGERRIQRVHKVVDPVGDARPDWQILCELMTACGLPQSYESPAEIMDEIARVTPAFTGVSYQRLDRDGLQWPVPEADHPGTTILHSQGFAGGRLEFACVPYQASPALADLDRFPLRLTTGRILEHYNCGSMTRRSPNADLRDHDAIELCQDDANRLGIADGSRVRVTSAHGEIEATAAVSERILPGRAFLSFHFPETATNRLTGVVLDRLADCPEYKLIPIAVEAISPSSA